jgi:hypothetical protein
MPKEESLTDLKESSRVFGWSRLQEICSGSSFEPQA